MRPDWAYDHREKLGFLWCRRMLSRVVLPPTVGHHADFRVWQRKSCGMNIGMAMQVEDKLNYMHKNPMERGLVKESAVCPWSSWRYYSLQHASLLAMDKVP
jgi:hypothetical protein